jgi:hypothetical protein
MTTTLSILNGSGDQTLTWNHNIPEDVAKIREIIAALKSAGYQFFLVDGTPADEVTAGAGTLIVKKLTAEELTAAPDLPLADELPAEATLPDAEPDTTKKGRGRKAIAVRPMSGGSK